MNNSPLGRRLKLRDLNALIAVAKYGSMGKAAVQLSISQPAISRMVAEMEQMLGVQLLDRTPQGVVPTIYGQTLIDRGLVVFDELQEGLKQIRHLADPTAGEVRVGAPIVHAEGLVTAVIGRLSQRHPRLVFRLTTGETSAMYRAVEERKVDLAVVGIFGPIAGVQLDTKTLFHQRYVVVAGAANPWVRRRKVDLGDLMKEPWVLPPPDSVTGAICLEAFRAKRLGLPQRTTFSVTVPVRKALVMTGPFITVIPAITLAFPTDGASIKRLPIELPTTQRPVGIITRKNRMISSPTKLFIDTACEITRPFADKS